MNNNSVLKWILITQIMLMFYSTGGIFSKLASGEQFLSFKFCLYYGIVLLNLAAYAVGWQQVIRHLPLTTAYANKAITVVWGIVWGAVFFHEQITAGKIIGAILVIFGVVLYAGAENEAAS